MQGKWSSILEKQSTDNASKGRAGKAEGRRLATIRKRVSSSFNYGSQKEGNEVIRIRRKLAWG